jgi:hypothetical protein
VDFIGFGKQNLLAEKEAILSNTATLMLTPTSVHIAATANNSIILNS